METNYNDEKIIDSATLSQMAVAYASTLKAFENAGKYLHNENKNSTAENSTAENKKFKLSQSFLKPFSKTAQEETALPTTIQQTTDAILLQILEEVREIKTILIFNRRIRLG